MKLTGWLLLALSLFSGLAAAGETGKIRLGVMAGGTLAWELAAMRNEGLLNGSGIELESVTTANPQAGKVALQSGSVDIIISDWIWVSSMRGDGSDLTFYPYSDVSGSLLVSANSPIKTLADLKGKKLGVAGGELDKNWLLLQALGQKQGLDLNTSLEKVYGAPPLLNQQLTSGGIDALLTYWHFAARLQPQGYRQLMSGEELVRQLGISEALPNMGYVFKAGWAEQNKAALQTFFKLTKQARNRLCESDAAWQNIVALTETDNAEARQQLRRSYCEGRVEQWNAGKQQAAEEVYQWLRKIGSNKLTGKTEHISSGTFWSAD
jgi:NitT/TauT family transport system substrate-binding protein